MLSLRLKRQSSRYAAARSIRLCALCLRRLTAPLVLSCRLQRTICHQWSPPGSSHVANSRLGEREALQACGSFPSAQQSTCHQRWFAIWVFNRARSRSKCARQQDARACRVWFLAQDVTNRTGRRRTLNRSSTADQSGSACQWRFSPLRSPDITNSAMYRCSRLWVCWLEADVRGKVFNKRDDRVRRCRFAIKSLF